MASFHIRTAALLVACIAMTAPSFAQRGDRRGDGDRDRGSRGRVESQGRAPSQRRAEAPRRAVPRERVAPRPRPGGGAAGNHGHRAPRYNSRPYATRSYVRPYGYRPYGYRPGWSLNVYFGRPRAVYGYGYPASAYGYYAVAPGVVYGAVRIVDAPRAAQVFVDGYYAGVVDDYDGVFQHLNLEAGAHHIEIEAGDDRLIAFDVDIRPGQTITYRAHLR